jgi:hypothetical protein
MIVHLLPFSCASSIKCIGGGSEFVETVGVAGD